MLRHALLLICLASPLPLLHAGEAPPSLQEAKLLYESGKAAMRDAETSPPRLVDAAIAFGKALKTYESEQDIDMISELNASLYWCRKKMDVDVLKTYRSLAGTDGAVQETLVKADQVASQQVDVAKAKDYLARAKAFAAKNPGDQLSIAVRYFEVVERFSGTPEANEALKLTQAATAEAMKQVTEKTKAIQASRETLFSKPLPVSATGRLAVPAADVVKTARSDIKKFYKEDYAKTKRAAKQRLARKLMDEALKTKDDPKMMFTMLQEARTVAVEAKAWDVVLDACDLLAQRFDTLDATTEKRTALEKEKGDSVAQGIVKLLADPTDTAANLTVGKAFVLLGDWESGLPMLALSTDANLKKASEMELAKPTTTAQIIEIGDAWYAAGKKLTSGPERDAYYSRALRTYTSVEKQLDGMSKDRIIARLDELDSALPLSNLDYNNLTVKQWDRLRAIKTVIIEARKDRSESGMTLAKGQRVRVVAHPADQWSFKQGGGQYACGWQGIKREVDVFFYYGSGRNRTFLDGALICQVGNGAMLAPGIIEGPGALWFAPNKNNGWDLAEGNGAIRVKILQPGEDE